MGFLYYIDLRSWFAREEFCSAPIMINSCANGSCLDMCSFMYFVLIVLCLSLRKVFWRLHARYVKRYGFSPWLNFKILLNSMYVCDTNSLILCIEIPTFIRGWALEYL